MLFSIFMFISYAYSNIFVKNFPSKLKRHLQEMDDRIQSSFW